MRRIVCADLRVSGNEHLIINHSILQGILELRYFENISVMCEHEHWQALKKINPLLRNVEASTYPRQYHSNSKLKTFYHREFKSIGRIFNLFRRCSSDDIILLLSVTPFVHIFIYLLTLVYNLKRKNIYVVLHGELEHLRDSNLSFSKLIMKCWDRISIRNITYVVLSGHIIKSDYFRQQNKQICSLVHPYSDQGCALSKERAIGNTINIGVPGVVKKRNKGLYLLNIVREGIDKNAKLDLELHLIGRMVSGFDATTLPDLKAPFLHYSQPVEQEKFDEYLSKMDILLLPYQTDSYELTASGAVYDALKFGHPMLGLRNPLFVHLESLNAFPGLLFDDIQDLSTYVENLTLTSFTDLCTKSIQSRKNLQILSDPLSNMKNCLLTHV